MKKSSLERAIETHMIQVGLPRPVSEFRFHPERRWRFDFAFPDLLVAVEVEGGVHTKGRHVRGYGFEQDAEKYNEAAIMGWLVVRLTGSMIKSGEGIRYVERAVASRKSFGGSNGK